MAARNPFASSLPDIYDVYAPQVSRRPQLSTGYHFIRYLLYVGAVVGGVVALYRNDVLLELARRAGQESRYLEAEKSLVGSPGWGTPRSMEPVLKGDAAETAPATAATSASDTTPNVPAAVATAPAETATASPVEAKPAASPDASPSEPARAGASVAEASKAEAPSPRAAATTPATAAPARAAVDPLAPVSLDSLPVLNKGGAPRSTAAAPRAPEPAPVSRAVAAAAAPHAAPAPHSAKAAKFSLEEDAPAPARHSAHASAPAEEPAPKPAAKPAPPPGPKTTDAHPNDNPLMAAVRGAVRSHPAKSSVPAAR